MKLHALAATLVLATGLAQAADVGQREPAAPAACVNECNTVPAAKPAETPAAAVAVQASPVPEPEVFAMMLLGLILIGYRARRSKSDKFEK